jgi:hypothetical protein
LSIPGILASLRRSFTYPVHTVEAKIVGEALDLEPADLAGHGYQQQGRVKGLVKIICWEHASGYAFELI